MVEPLMACVITARSPFPWSAQACLRLDSRQLAAAKFSPTPDRGSEEDVKKFSECLDSPLTLWLGIRADAGRSKLRQMKAVASYRTPRAVFGVRKLAAGSSLPGNLRRAIKIDSQC